MEVVRRKRAIFAFLVYKMFIRKINRRYWIHPYTELRLTRGRFVTSFFDLRDNPDKFFKEFRMSVKSFDELARRLTDKIKSQDTPMRRAIPPVEMLAITLK